MKALLLTIVNFPGVKHLIAGAAAVFMLFAFLGSIIFGLPILASVAVVIYDAASVFVDYVLTGHLNIQPLLSSDGLKIFADLSKDLRAGMGYEILRFYLIFTTIITLVLMTPLGKEGGLVDDVQKDLNELLS